MFGSGIGMLSVSLKQEGKVFKEIFRLHGEQGNKWMYAQVPITGLINNTMYFQVSISFWTIMLSTLNTLVRIWRFSSIFFLCDKASR